MTRGERSGQKCPRCGGKYPRRPAGTCECEAFPARARLNAPSEAEEMAEVDAFVSQTSQRAQTLQHWPEGIADQDGPLGPSPNPHPPVAGYPDNNPKTTFGLKKPSVHAIPPAAILSMGQVMALGKAKYGLMNWREKTVSWSVYYDAALRHLLAAWDGEDADPESGELHLAHAACCMSILIDAIKQGKINDDRPKVAGKAAAITRGEK